ncbi:MAG: STM3941 family protein [Pseudomonadota bacterium]
MTRHLDGGAMRGEGAIALYPARLRYWALLLLACGFVALGAFLLVAGDDDARSVAILCILFFGACALTFVWQIVDRRPRLILDDVGVFDRTLRVGRIPWSDIEDAYSASIHRQDFVCLILRDEAQWVAKLPPLQRRLVAANRALGFSGLNLNLSGLEADASTVLALILANSARHRAGDSAA